MRLPVASFLLLSLAAPAYAVDGVLEINQACAVNTGCFSGDSAGFPVEITQSGSYLLTGNLGVALNTETAIDVTSSKVSIDLNGFTISGPGTGGSGVGVLIDEVNSFRIRNGTISGISSAIQTDTAEINPSIGIRIENVSVEDSAGFDLNPGRNIVVTGCNIVGGRIFAGSAATIVNNTVTDSLVDGITIGSGLVIGNTVRDSGQIGISANQATIRDNSVVSNGSHGIMSFDGNVTPSFRLSSTTTRGAPPRRRNVFS